MIPETLRLKGFTKANRYEMIDYAVSSITKSSGWVINHTMYANKMIVINFELEAKGARKLIDLLNRNGMVLFDDSIRLADDFPEVLDAADEVREIQGSVNITFINDDPAVKMAVPPIPG
ncbi:hypothetical protein LRR81_13520 [Metabacillus sp. GX 13764]|uniref:hypothetical protein n=1 Tax=Metabacillus kandeliae TaxID=2900151 RepID=UPI001E44A0BD|nr:hypothetical protein [Metabacillus kandeliae]MCD7035261.1 hypothetical protein [Metabacillus kandeliae]